MLIQPYLFFGGRCDEAIAFYTQALGAQTKMCLRFRDSPQPQPIPLPLEWDDKVMHGELQIGETTILVSDGHPQEQHSFEGFSLSLIVDDVAAADQRFQALVEGGSVRMPLMQTFFSPRFGMLTDRFGLGWMIYAKS